MAVHPTNRLMLSVGRDETLRMWDLTKGHLAAKVKVNYLPEQVCWTWQGAHYAIKSHLSVKVHDPETTENVATFETASKIACMDSLGVGSF